MTELQDYLFDLLPQIRNGDCPVATSREIHLTAHRIVADKNADCRMEEMGIREERLKESKKAMDRVKD